MAEELRGVLMLHFSRYPDMEPRDAVKLVYQHAMGAGHLISDPDSALARLAEERQSCTADPAQPLSEPLGGGLCRLNLNSPEAGAVSDGTLARLFALGAEQTPRDGRRLEQGLALLEELAAGGEAPFSSRALADFLTQYRREGCPAVGHSAGYRSRCSPAYRVLPAAFLPFWPLFAALDGRMAAGARTVLAIDGMAAAGKSSLARLLERVYGAAVVHMDHFFLPRDLRTAGRFEEPGGNVHYERFAREVLPRLGEGAPFSYRRFDCGTMDFAPRPVTLPAAQLTVVEGAYSLRPEFRAAYHMTVFLSLPEEEQRARILRRDGPDMWERFRTQWLPLEARYFAANGLPAGCTFSLTTGDR